MPELLHDRRGLSTNCLMEMTCIDFGRCVGSYVCTYVPSVEQHQHFPVMVCEEPPLSPMQGQMHTRSIEETMHEC
jgi:hypothetical protein